MAEIEKTEVASPLKKITIKVEWADGSSRQEESPQLFSLEQGLQALPGNQKALFIHINKEGIDKTVEKLEALVAILKAFREAQSSVPVSILGVR